MSIDEMINNNIKERDELGVKKAIVRKNNIESLAIIIEELYHLRAVANIELKILIQEEDFGTLFTCPQFLFVPFENKEICVQKDINWHLESITHKSKYKKRSMVSRGNYVDPKNIQWNDNIFMLINTMTDILDQYEWDHFVNIGSFERSSLWKSHQDNGMQNKREHVWIGDLSECNYTDTLTVIADKWKFDNLKELVIKKQTLRLDEALTTSNSMPTSKNKI